MCVLLLTACGPGSSDATADQVTACETTLRARFEALATTGTVPDATRPPECNPLTDVQMAEVGRRLTDG